MEIKDHKLTGEGTRFEQTPNVYSNPYFADGYPDSIIIHYTAMSSLDDAVKVLTNPDVSGSAHLVVGKKGEIVQLAPFNFRTWHAGKSEYGGRKFYNNYAIGIEIDNVGWLKKYGDQYSRHELKKQGITYTKSKVVQEKHWNPKVPYEYWEVYPDKQIETVIELCHLLYNNYRIREILGHDEIAPDRKQDPGPAFPMDELRQEVLMRDNYAENFEDLEIPVGGQVTASKLNIRSGPDAGANTVALPLEQGQKVQIHEEKNGWLRVTTEIEGWVSREYINTAL